MTDDSKARLRELIMDTFRRWGGQWNVTLVEPGEGAAPPDAWALRVHSRPIARGTLPDDVARAYLEDPEAPATLHRWEDALRPTFQKARDAAP